MRARTLALALLGCFALASAPRAEQPAAEEAGETGVASWYGDSLAGRRTASGERFDPDALTAAHRSLPFGARVELINLATEQRVVVRINDRGPVSEARMIDVSHAAAEALGFVRTGTAEVRMRPLPPDE